MKVLIIENDRSNQAALKKVFMTFGNCNFALNSNEAVNLYEDSWKDCRPYDLICADINMSGTERQNMMNRIREIENEMGIEDQDGAIVITTAALDEQRTVIEKDRSDLVLAYPCGPVPEREPAEKARILCLLG